jgi:hypothetical protein
VDQPGGHDQDDEAQQDLKAAHHHHPDRGMLDVLLLLGMGDRCWRSILLLWDGVSHCGLESVPQEWT